MSRSKVERKYNPAQFDDAFESLTINRRRCIAFRPNSPNDQLCHCNRSRHEHPNTNDHSRSYEKWQRDMHTVKDPTIEQGVSLVNGAPYLRCDIETDPSIIETVLFDIWRVQQPTVLMQLTGGNKYFKLRGSIEVSFLDDLVQFVCKSNIWLITNGSNVGIVQLIGQAIRKRKLTKPLDSIVAIGVCNYGSVKNVNDFQRPEHIDQSLSNSSVSQDGNSTISQKTIIEWRLGGEQNLEMNHTHYILLDDGTLRHYDIGDYRARLAKTIANGHAKKLVPVPIVTLLFEGGEDSVRSIYNDLRTSIPVIIVNNTGRIADYLARWLSRTQEMDLDANWTTPVDIDAEHTHNESRLRAKFDKYISAMNEELIEAINGYVHNRSAKFNNPGKLKTVKDEIILMIMYCLQPAVRSKITVFNFNKDAKLPEIILRSIYKSFGETHQKQQKSCVNKHRDKIARNLDYLLELALDWDCISMAKEWIIQDSLDNIQNKKAIFCRALTKQRHKFVHYFIQLGLQFDEVFFDPKLNPFAARNGNQQSKRYSEFLRILYTEDAINREDWLLRDVITTTNERNRKVIRSTDDLNQLFRNVVGGYMKPLYYDSQLEEQHDRMGVKHFTSSISPISDIEQEQLIASDAVYKQLAKDYVMRDLFLWAIVMNYMDLAKVFIGHMKDRMCGALVATEIFSHLRDTCADAVYGDKKADLTRWINYFEQYAINCMDLCFKNDPDMARILTVQRVELFGDVTCLQVAHDADSKRFASHPACRQAENSIWYDKLHPDQTHLRHHAGQLIAFWTLGLLAPFVARFRTINKNQCPIAPTLQPYGINYCDPYAINHFQGTVTKNLSQMWQFHQSLHIKFMYHYAQYIGFVLLFSYVLLFHFDPITVDHPSIDATEILVIILVSCMFIEEIRIFFNQDSLSFLGKCHNYFRYFFKQLCIISFILFYIGLILRFQAGGNSTSFLAARIIMGYNIWICWIQCLSFIIVNPYLGPHLVSIGKMLKNLAFFAILIAIVMTAYGVASRSMAYYGLFEFSVRNVFRYILYPVYYLLYTNLSSELNDLDDAKNQTPSIATHILLAFHMLLINILLANLLIAMFNRSFQDVQSVQSDIWNFQQYSVVREYYDRPPLFIPFSTVFDLIALTNMLYQWYLRVRYQYVNPTQRVFKVIAVQPELEFAWQEFESASTYAYAQREALTKVDRSIIESKPSLRQFEKSEQKAIDLVNLPSDHVRKENNSINQLRTELKTSIRDIRNELRLLTKHK